MKPNPFSPTPALALVAALALAACEHPVDDPIELATEAAEIKLADCPAVACPAAVKCDRNWNDAGRKADWPACAPPPADGCSQVVFGRFEDMKKYIGCPGYITLNLKNWTKDLNDEFVGCAAAGLLGATCKPPILVASKDGDIPNDGNTTERELCQLHKCGCVVTTNAGGTGGVDEPDPKKPTCKVATVPKAKPKAKKKNPTTCALAHTASTDEATPIECAEEESWSCAACDPETDEDCVYDEAECGCEPCADDDDDPMCVEASTCGADPVPAPVEPAEPVVVEDEAHPTW